jgi:myo-inositol-1(or 4)-monophosphatase
LDLSIAIKDLQMHKEIEFLSTAIELAQAAGRTLLETFGTSDVIDKKGDHSNVVTAADSRSEEMIVRGIRSAYPSHSIIAEETGCDLRGSQFTWVVDPLDGTSNYAAGVPWFGVLISVLKDEVPVAGVIYLPVTGDLYSAQAGAGAYRNGKRIAVTREQKLENVLWAYGMDGGSSEEQAARNVAVLAKLLCRVRNVRATNSLVDPAYTSDGRLGGMLNQSTRLWDIAAPMLIVQEAGGMYTDVVGRPLKLDISRTAADKEYAILAGAPALHEAVAAIVRETLPTQV